MDKNKDKEDQSIMDKSMRSVFVGNIPYEATEEKLKDIFSEVGPVLSFKLVFDRETGKPKGYGFCEYKDQETALSAMRNLNGYEIGGRSLRVDNACTEKSRMEMQALMQGPLIENPYGEAIEPEKAPEAISKAVASLPPEQMFELMKQMKLCVQNNPTEARTMLLQNPQLAYALLQAQVIMRIVDPATAVTMLHGANQIPPILQPGGIIPAHVPDKPPANVGLSAINLPSAPGPPSLLANPPLPAGPPLGVPPPMSQPFANVGMQDVDLRSLENSRVRPPPSMGDQDMRSLPPPLPTQPPLPTDSPSAALDAINDSFNRDPRVAAASFPTDPRQRPADPRQAPKPAPLPPGMPNAAQTRTIQGIPSGASDQEKAALIMQVLQLSDEQIAMLPPEQRTSILVLKEQIAKSTQQR